jgi:hypothetical protein
MKLKASCIGRPVALVKGEYKPISRWDALDREGAVGMARASNDAEPGRRRGVGDEDANLDIREVVRDRRLPEERDPRGNATAEDDIIAGIDRSISLGNICRLRRSACTSGS